MQSLPFEFPLDKIHHFKDARLVSYLSDADRPGLKVGAVIHKGNKKLAFGCNSYSKTHTIQNENCKKYLHAEISALIKRRHYEDITSCSMTVYREVNNGTPALTIPCQYCQKILKKHGIKKVYYSKPEAPYFDVLIL